MAHNLSSQLQNEIEPLQSSLKSADETLRKDFSKMRPEFGQEAERVSNAEVASEHAGSGDDVPATPADPGKNPAADEPTAAHNKPS